MLVPGRCASRLTAMGANVRVRLWRNESGILLSRDAQRPGSGVGWFWGRCCAGLDRGTRPLRVAAHGGEVFGDVWTPGRCASRLTWRCNGGECSSQDVAE